MAAVVIRNLSAETHRAIKERARRHGRSAEAEMRAILEESARKEQGIGAQLRALGATLDGLDVHFERDASPPREAGFE